MVLLVLVLYVVGDVMVMVVDGTVVIVVGVAAVIVVGIVHVVIAVFVVGFYLCLSVTLSGEGCTHYHAWP